jgi:integrase
MLTDSKVRHFKPQARQYKRYDKHGLYLIVTPKGGKWWRYRYKQGGKENTLSLEIYAPSNVLKHVSLADARNARDEMAKRLKDGKSPKSSKTTDHATFKWAMLEWLSRRTTWSEETHHQNKSRLDSYVIPYLGDRKLTDIDTGDVLQVLRRIEATGKLATMSEVKSLISRVFGYAIAVGELKHNPSSEICEDALSAYKTQHFARLTDVNEIAGLVRAIDGYKGAFVTRLALKWSMLTFARSGEVRRAEWSEIEGAVWRIPAYKKKAKRAHNIDFQISTSDTPRSNIRRYFWCLLTHINSPRLVARMLICWVGVRHRSRILMVLPQLAPCFTCYLWQETGGIQVDQ